MKTQIKVTYPGPINVKADKKIADALESIGAKWYAQGTNLMDRERDIRFNLDI